MEIYPDLKEFCALLNANDVDFIVIGAYALGFHGAPRLTGDLDILLNPTSGNAKKMLEVLSQFGFNFPNLTVADFVAPDQVIQLGYPPVRIDLLTSISGVTWDEASAGKVAGALGGVPMHFLGREQYIANKRACGRLRDLADLEALGEV